MHKVLWVKFGWSEYYRGGAVDGNFGYLNHGGSGHEAWNFRRHSDGGYYCYVPPQRESYVPTNNDQDGWTVICLSKIPKRTGIHIVGWYEDATLVGAYSDRPKQEGVPERAPDGTNLSYCIHSNRAYLVPPNARVDPFSHPSVRRGKYSFLRGAGTQQTPNKLELLDVIEKKLRTLKEVAIALPTETSISESKASTRDSAHGFGTAEHRKRVEVAAIKFATKTLEQEGYRVTSREKDNIGFDLEAINIAGDALHVEVKGTSGALPKFFLSRNEKAYSTSSIWRFMIVTNALGDNPEVQSYNLKEFQKTFELSAISWQGSPKDRSN